MALRNLVLEGDPLLRKTSRPVEEITPRIIKLLDDMADTMYFEGRGIGIAAPQVGVLRRVFIVDVGDEHGHFWMTEDGKAYAQDGNTKTYKQVEKKTIIERAKVRRAKVNAKRVQKRQFGHPTTILGQKKAIMLLVNFNDTKFNTAHDNALYQRIANEENFSEGKFKGSMADYFKAQSRGKFELDFDVVGPLTVSQNASYYGENDENDNDMHSGQMVCEAVKLAKEQVSDWTPYDWDGDGEVDQVMIIYAGEGEADGGDENTIWPHEWELRYAEKAFEIVDGITINTYAVANEGCKEETYYSSKFQINGIGTVCHEFSHCLGLMDMYDVSYSGYYGMGEWSIMDSGSYNGNGFVPSGYTSYDKYCIGWMEPIELTAEKTVSGMRALTDADDVYIIKNAAHPDERCQRQRIAVVPAVAVFQPVPSEFYAFHFDTDAFPLVGFVLTCSAGHLRETMEVHHLSQRHGAATAHHGRGLSREHVVQPELPPCNLSQKGHHTCRCLLSFQRCLGWQHSSAHPDEQAVVLLNHFFERCRPRD